jgi:hypothetical protein
MGNSSRGLALAVSLGFLSSTPVHAQVRASERSTVSQTSDGTVVTINYARPHTRARADLFGKVVEWGEVWTPGANWATTIEASRDISIGGHKVPKGKYSVWFVVKPNEWMLVLDPRTERYHTEHPDSTAQQIRWAVQPTTADYTEILTWSFPDVRPDGMTLRFAWGTKALALDVGVTPSHPLPIARNLAEPFLGTYKWKWTDEDTSKTMTMTLTHDGTVIRQRYDPFPDWYPRLQDQIMVRINDDWFIPVIVRDGKIWEMVSDMVFEFTVKDGVAVSFEVRDDKDHLLAVGERIKR